MKESKGTPDNGSLWSNGGLVALAIGAGILIVRGTERILLDLWVRHPVLLVSITGFAILALIFLALSKWWNWKVDQEYERGITAPDPGAVSLGRNEQGNEVYLKQRFRTMHTQVIGTTSAGKTESVILPWAINDIESGNGLLIIDGKSDSSFLDKLYAYVCRSERERDFRLFSLAHVGSSHTFNPLIGGGPAEVVERVFASFQFENEYYRNVQYKVFLLLIRLIQAKGKTPTFFLIHRLLTDMRLVSDWAADLSDDILRYEIQRLVKESPKDRSEKTSGLETYLSHFAQGEYSVLFNSETPHIRFDEVLDHGRICYFQLPSMYLPFLAQATGKLVLQSFQNAVSKRHFGRSQDMKFFSCFLDDFQDYIYEGFGALLNKSRSANIGVVFSHQAIGDLNKVSPAFTNVVLTNTNIKCLMRTSDPDTSDYFAKSIGTVKSEKVTERRKESLFGAAKTGDGSVREVDEYLIHPNEIRTQGTGRGIVTIPHAKGVKVVRMKFDRRDDLPALPIPEVAKEIPRIESVLAPTETETSAAVSRI